MRPSKIDVDRGVSVLLGTPRCLYDGAIMSDSVTFVIGWWGSEPVFVFTCPLCGSEGEIA